MLNENARSPQLELGQKVAIIPIKIEEESDIVAVRNIVKAAAGRLKFGLIDITKLITAVSELARNTLIHGGGGIVIVDEITSGNRVGLRVVFEDEGPGIANITQAMQDGFTTWNGMGIGLPGSKRVVDEFRIESEVDKGTRVEIVKFAT
jgi:serine/threonine-protein kinase RsbT